MLDTLSFELYDMDLAEECNSADDLMKLSMQLHESIENAIYDICYDKKIIDYDPLY